MSHADKHLGAERVVHAEMPRPRGEMNLTPLIDVLLVLLVIFSRAARQSRARRASDRVNANPIGL